MPSKVDAKASTTLSPVPGFSFSIVSSGLLSYLKRISPCLVEAFASTFDLNPGTGDSVVKNKTFTNGKVGKSDNVLEFYTIDGNIILKHCRFSQLYH
jgi:hypothetical protein